MKRTFALIGCAGLGLLLAIPTRAITLSFNPSTQYTHATSVDVALVISGLTAGAAPSLSVFDLDVSFNPAILSFGSAVFGDPVLGDQLDLLGLGSLTSASGGAGTVNLLELSFDSVAALDALQAGDFTLATLNFNTLSNGISSLGLAVNALGDSNGGELTADIGSGIIGVPEPSSLALISMGILGVIGTKRRRRL